MTQVASIDFATKRIHLHADTVTNGFDCIAAYFEINLLIVASSLYQGYQHMMSAEGYISKGSGDFTPRYGLSAIGWRYVPYALVAHTLSVDVEPVSLDGLSGRDVFDRSSIVVNVDIDEAYEKIEIREINTGGSTPALSAAESAQLAKVDKLYIEADLDENNPNTYADDASSVTNNVFTLTKAPNGNGTFTVNKT